MSLEPFNPELSHPELLHRALENELETHEIPAWENLRLEPDILKAISNLEFVTRELRSLPREHAPPGLALNLSRRIAGLLPEVAPGSLEIRSLLTSKNRTNPTKLPRSSNRFALWYVRAFRPVLRRVSRQKFHSRRNPFCLQFKPHHRSISTA
jgi:hypothetical protein